MKSMALVWQRVRKTILQAKIGTTLAVIGVVLAAGCANPSAGSGPVPTWQIDPDFGTNGVMKADIDSENVDNYLNHAVIDSNGRIVITGSGPFDSPGVYKMYASRYNADGTLDTSFGTGGVFIESTDSIGRGIAFDSAGRIFIGGYRNSGSDKDAAVWCLDSNGSLDTTFGSGGIATNDIAARDDEAKRIVVDTSGRVILSGYTMGTTGTDLALWRFDSNGSLDTGFGTGGTIVMAGPAGGTGNDVGNGMAIDSQGRIVVAGTSRNGSGNFDFVALRFDPDGTLDSDFGSSGVAAYDGGSYEDGLGMAVDGNDRVLVSGGSIPPSQSRKDMCIVRFTADGDLDASFGTGGVVLSDFAGEDDFSWGMTTDSANRVFAAGFTKGISTEQNTTLWAYEEDGSPMSGFGSGGFIRVEMGGSTDTGTVAVADGQDRILLAGEFNSASSRDVFLTSYVYR